MSHYTVAVVHHPNQNVDEMLAPFYEGLAAEFYDITDELRYRYENETQTLYAYDSENDWEYYDDAIWDEISEEEYEDLKAQTDNSSIPNLKPLYPTKHYCGKYYKLKEDVIPREVPLNELYDFEYYCEEVCGYQKVDGRYGYWHNPDAKWDWYSYGGRWNGMLRLKPGGTGTYGEDGVFGHMHEDDGVHVSEAAIKDIDFSPDKDVYEQSLRWWQVIVEGAPLEEGEEEYHSFYKTEYLLERYGNGENYATENAAFSTYAVLTPDGIWHEPGRMGWWGISCASSDEESSWYANYYDAFIKNADPDDILTIIDCHI